MKSNAIVYSIAGNIEAVKKAASKLQTLHQVEGKIVRKYERQNVPRPLPDDADVIIIVETP